MFYVVLCCARKICPYSRAPNVTLIIGLFYTKGLPIASAKYMLHVWGSVSSYVEQDMILLSFSVYSRKYLPILTCIKRHFDHWSIFFTKSLPIARAKYMLHVWGSVSSYVEQEIILLSFSV